MDCLGLQDIDETFQVLYLCYLVGGVGGAPVPYFKEGSKSAGERTAAVAVVLHGDPTRVSGLCGKF